MNTSAVAFTTLGPSRVQDGARTRRFAWVTAGHRIGPDPVFDHDLAGADNAAVIPTKGAIIPEWVMVIPRAEALSVAEMPAGSRRALFRVARQVGRRVQEAAGASVIFEHGAGRVGSASGCGVDQAHLHVVGMGRDFVQAVLYDRANWEKVDPDDPWAEIPNGADYLLVVQDNRAWTALTPIPMSQFMRRRIAHFVGSPGEWDYRRYPHADNAERTKAIFRSFEIG